MDVDTDGRTSESQSGNQANDGVSFELDLSAPTVSLDPESMTVVTAVESDFNHSTLIPLRCARRMRT